MRPRLDSSDMLCHNGILLGYAGSSMIAEHLLSQQLHVPALLLAMHAIVATLAAPATVANSGRWFQGS